jgi:hypothetical protein
MRLSFLMLGVALGLSAIAAFYSIAGLTAIFAAAVVPIVVMGTILEVAKITVTVWLHEYWDRCRLTLKLYLVPAVAVLMLITSIGVFGFLSKAHLDQTVPTSDVAAQVALIDEKIKTQRDNIDAARAALAQLDAQVNQRLAGANAETSAERSVQIRRQQARERAQLQKDIAAAQQEIAQLNEQRAPVASQLRQVEAEVGPIKYIAALIYGDNPDADLLEKSVRWVIILLVVVFDPLAIMMLLAATESFKWHREQKEKSLAALAPVVTDDHAADTVDEKTKDPEPEKPKPRSLLDQFPYLSAGGFGFKNNRPMVFSPTPDSENKTSIEEDLEGSEHEKEAQRLWKLANPESTLKEQRDLLAKGLINHLPWQNYLKLQADNHINHFVGKKFPGNAFKGDLFVKTDVVPTAVYKFNGNQWIAVDKSTTDIYTYDTVYIDWLIARLDSGEYDPELLTDAEKSQISERIQNIQKERNDS